ncbi:DUF2345 domain-containing protein [Acinetobacter sp. WZC-1]|uniref:DUF2345 domain-containing protein n=1 Tax=Acinetobacter sp. WZC-1 TaxID=3459034 RepID=UPI00403D9347
MDIRAHSNGIDLISRNDMQIDSTEEHIDFSAAHEISIKSLNSEVIINGSGIYLITKGKCTIYAAQYDFGPGEQVAVEMPHLPIVNEIKTFTNKWDFYDLFYEADFSEVKYKLINNKNNTYVSGGLDQHGRTQRMNTANNEDYDMLIGTDDDWSISVDDGSNDDNFEYNCSCGSHEYHEHEGEI